MQERGTWYRRFADVPGVEYPGDPQRRARLADRDVVPERHEFMVGGRRSVSLSWPSPAGSTSASPVHRVAFGDFRSETSEQLRERVLSALELPGELLDYHFVIQGAAETLYRRRRSEPGQLALVEWLASIDARLVECHEAAFRISPENEQYLGVFAFDFLVRMHEREGYLHEALALAERFSRFRSGVDTISELRTRVAALRAEHA